MRAINVPGLAKRPRFSRPQPRRCNPNPIVAMSIRLPPRACSKRASTVPRAHFSITTGSTTRASQRLRATDAPQRRPDCFQLLRPGVEGRTELRSTVTAVSMSYIAHSSHGSRVNSSSRGCFPRVDSFFDLVLRTEFTEYRQSLLDYVMRSASTYKDSS